MESSKNYIDIGCYQLNKAENEVCGDVFFSRKMKKDDKTFAVLADGLGTGIKANIMATTAASMALNYTVDNASVKQASELIMNTFPFDLKSKKAQSTFTIINIDNNAETEVISYDCPEFLLIRGDKIINIPHIDVQIDVLKRKQELLYFKFKLEKEDRIVIFTNGVTKSGFGNANMLLGWGIEKIKSFLLKNISKNKFISSQDLSKKVTHQACSNDILKPRDDLSCAVIYFREPRKLLISTGPPFYEEEDKKLAEIVRDFKGKKIIAGGTTSQIIARELGKKIESVHSFSHLELPPVAKIEGIGMVTEGILTLGKVYEKLKNKKSTDISGEGPDVEILKNMFTSDIIEFIVGTKINTAHLNPNLPIELEVRRYIVKKIIKLLENKFFKEVHLKFI
ncbi:MAG: SpoIIE family protein phosphatase [Bacteroidetes bacterium]|nr:SpoIIE family protein phosphatase [Bacteroidota bacterium]